jgi:hypothetical protein
MKAALKKNSEEAASKTPDSPLPKRGEKMRKRMHVQKTKL